MATVPSSVHARGVPPDEAAVRIVALADRMRQAKVSGVAVKEDLAALPPGDRTLSLQGPVEGGL